MKFLGDTRELQRVGTDEFSREWSGCAILHVRVPLDIPKTRLYHRLGGSDYRHVGILIYLNER